MSQSKYSSTSFQLRRRETTQYLSDSDHFSDAEFDLDLDPELDLGRGGKKVNKECGGRFWCLMTDSDSDSDSEDDGNFSW